MGSGQVHTSLIFLHGKDHPVRDEHEAGWAPKPVWSLWKKEKSFASVGNRITIPRSCIPYSSQYTD
jgi:hypothetical protein